MRTRTVAALAAALSLVCAAPAAADSISYIKDGNVWLSTPDGARQLQVTTAGGYSFASQADDGTIVALNGQRLHRLSPDGKLLADFSTPVSDGDGKTGSHFSGPFNPVVSPDGKTVAYDYFFTGYDPTNPGCLPPVCIERRIEAGVGYSRADQLTPWDTPGYGRQSGWQFPSWIDNNHTLLSDKAVRYGNHDVFVDTLGDGPTTTLQWFSDDGSWYMRDGEQSRQGTKLAFVGTEPKDPNASNVGFQDDQIRIYRTNGAAPALPEACYWYGQPDGAYQSPSWSPDGSRIAFAQYQGTNPGILVADVPDFSAGCQTPSAGATMLIPGGSVPDWGPADVPVKVPPPPDRKLSVQVAKSAKLSTVLKRGFVVNVKPKAAGPATVEVKAGSKRLAKVRGAIAATGGKLTVKFSKTAGKTLRKLRKPSLKVTVTVGGEKATATVALRK